MRWTVLAASLCLASAAHAGTLLFLNSQAGDYIGQGEGRLITSADGTFTASRNLDNGVSVDFAGGAPGDFWSLDFAAPMGTTLVPGAYEGATRWPFQAASSPGLSVYGDGRGCNTLTGRFVVLEATYGADGKVESFAADFEQHCGSAAPALFGSIRYDAGDPACAGQPDGTPCSVGDPCTVGDRCESGVCTAGSPLSCDDGDLCTDETCDSRLGCLVTPVPCWHVAGRATVWGLGGIQAAPAPPHFTSTLVLRIDGTYRLPSTHITSCGADIPDEVGTYRAGRHGRLVLTPTNLDEIDAVGAICIGYPLTVTSYRTVVKLSRSGLRLHGTSTLAASLEIFAQAIPFHAVATFKGMREP